MVGYKQTRTIWQNRSLLGHAEIAHVHRQSDQVEFSFLVTRPKETYVVFMFNIAFFL
jgi:hypothetical protein